MLENMDINEKEIKQKQCLKTHVREALKKGITCIEVEEAVLYRKKKEHKKEKNTICR